VWARWTRRVIRAARLLPVGPGLCEWYTYQRITALVRCFADRSLLDFVFRFLLFYALSYFVINEI